MPGYDGTGPRGSGPGTGGGFGCCGHPRSRRCGRGSGGWGAGRGTCGGIQRFGAGRRLDFSLPARDAASETAWLKYQAARLKAQLESIGKRLDGIEERRPADDQV